MPKVNANEFADKWGRRLKGAIEDVKAGVAKVTESPTAKAADKQEKMKQKIIEAIENGSWAKGLKAVSLEDWKNKMINVGANRISSGVDGAGAKVTAFAEKLLSHESGLQAQVKKMPDLTIEDSINRATTWIRGMSKFKK